LQPVGAALRAAVCLLGQALEMLRRQLAARE
jgi:hypothetical protein